MKKLSKTNAKAERRKLVNSTAAENKLLAAIKKLSKIKLPKDATLEDYKKAAEKINFKKLLPHIQRYAISVLRSNHNGFKAIANALIEGGTGKTKLQQKIDNGFQSLMREKRLFEPLLRKFSKNVELIKNIPNDVYDKLKEGYEKGLSFRGTDVEEYLLQTMGKRARTIIRTESSKLSTALTEVRARNLDIPAYIWSTSVDQRVRPSHQAMDNVLVFWDTILTLDGMKGHAGEFPNCRCIPLPVVEIDDIQFPVKVARGNLKITSKYVKGSHGKKYNVKIESGKIVEYTRQRFIAKFGHLFNYD